MQNLYTISTINSSSHDALTPGERFSVLYHNIFDYPLSFYEIVRWRAGENKILGHDRSIEVVDRNGYWFLNGREGLVYKRILRGRISERKMRIAERVSKLLTLVPSIKMVAVTGSLAMGNSSEESDIDLMLVTKKGTLWMTRLFVYLMLLPTRFSLRRPSVQEQKDKLCLNVWLDESDLVWNKGKRNFYTAHEISQIVPLVNKGKTYEKFLWENKWILSYWPGSVRIKEKSGQIKKLRQLSRSYLTVLFEKLAFNFQYSYMKKKITHETITPTRALFHPNDWGKLVSKQLSLLT